MLSRGPTIKSPTRSRSSRGRARAPARLSRAVQRRLTGNVRALLFALEAARPPTRRAVAAELLAIGVALERRGRS